MTRKGCMKVTTLKESLTSCRRKRGSSAYDMRTMRLAPSPTLMSSLPTTAAELSALGKTVTFGNLFVRKYSKTSLDDNPAVTSGAPIALGGTFVDYPPAPVEAYESRRGRRMRNSELRLSEKERLRRLVSNGYSTKEIQEAITFTKKIQTKRAKTLQSYSYDEVMDVLVSKLNYFGKVKKANKSSEADSKAAKTA